MSESTIEFLQLHNKLAMQAIIQTLLKSLTSFFSGKDAFFLIKYTLHPFASPMANVQNVALEVVYNNQEIKSSVEGTGHMSVQQKGTFHQTR